MSGLKSNHFLSFSQYFYAHLTFLLHLTQAIVPKISNKTIGSEINATRPPPSRIESVTSFISELFETTKSDNFSLGKAFNSRESFTF